MAEKKQPKLSDINKPAPVKPPKNDKYKHPRPEIPRPGSR